MRWPELTGDIAPLISHPMGFRDWTYVVTPIRYSLKMSGELEWSVGIKLCSPHKQEALTGALGDLQDDGRDEDRIRKDIYAELYFMELWMGSESG